jgi:hypothetical protein
MSEYLRQGKSICREWLFGQDPDQQPTRSLYLLGSNWIPKRIQTNPKSASTQPRRDPCDNHGACIHWLCRTQVGHYLTWTHTKSLVESETQGATRRFLLLMPSYQRQKHCPCLPTSQNAGGLVATAQSLSTQPCQRPVSEGYLGWHRRSHRPGGHYLQLDR